MSEREPDRLTDASDDPLLRELLGAGRKELPDEAQLAAVMAKLGPVIGPDGGGGGSGGGASGATKAAWIGSAKVVAVIGGLTAALWGMSDLGPKPSEPPREVTRTETAASAMTASPMPSASASAQPPVEASAPTPSSKAAHPASPRTATSVTTDDPEAEQALLTRAQIALRTNAAEALALADESARRFPNGMFRQEAEVIAIDALARAHQTDAARARATKFRAAYPTSPHLARIETILQPKP